MGFRTLTSTGPLQGGHATVTMLREVVRSRTPVDDESGRVWLIRHELLGCTGARSPILTEVRTPSQQRDPGAKPASSVQEWVDDHGPRVDPTQDFQARTRSLARGARSVAVRGHSRIRAGHCSPPLRGALGSDTRRISAFVSSLVRTTESLGSRFQFRAIRAGPRRPPGRAVLDEQRDRQLPKGVPQHFQSYWTEDSLNDRGKCSEGAPKRWRMFPTMRRVSLTDSRRP